MFEPVEIDGIQLHLATPDDSDGEWIGQREILKQVLACWLTVDERDLPLTPRLVGTPGIGKTSLAIEVANRIDAEVISLDSRQAYRDFVVGTAAPTARHSVFLPSSIAGIELL